MLSKHPADEAIAGGAAGLVYIRVKEGGEIEAAKPVMEGLTPEQQAALVAQLQVGRRRGRQGQSAAGRQRAAAAGTSALVCSH